MKNTHTPGPWNLTFGEYEAAIHSDVTIASINDDALAWKENARLISAAPDLLSALEALLYRSVSLDQSATHDGLQNCAAIAQAREAISKAKGEKL
jgi:hypothetical protein